MMILSIVATVVLLGALFYHRVSLLLSSVILLAWTAALGAPEWNIWLLLPIILLPFNFAPMRKSMISAPASRFPQGDAADVAYGKRSHRRRHHLVGRRSVPRQSGLAKSCTTIRSRA
jgi:hypothetical protein